MGRTLNTIKARNQAAAVESETLLLRAMCDHNPNAEVSVKDYIADDCVMALPGYGILTESSEPTPHEALDEMEPWTTYEINGEQHVVEIDMMSVSILYDVTLSRMRGKKVEQMRATVSSSWRQGAGGEWKLCAHHMAQTDA